MGFDVLIYKGVDVRNNNLKERFMYLLEFVNE